MKQNRKSFAIFGNISPRDMVWPNNWSLNKCELILLIWFWFLQPSIYFGCALLMGLHGGYFWRIVKADRAGRRWRRSGAAVMNDGGWVRMIVGKIRKRDQGWRLREAASYVCFWCSVVVARSWLCRWEFSLRLRFCQVALLFLETQGMWQFVLSRKIWRTLCCELKISEILS